jgi:type IV pilus assembly protein PilN
LKPIHLNLAARPYRDYRPVYAAVVVLSLLTAFLMLNNIETYYRYIRETKTTRTKIASLETQLQKERQRLQMTEQRKAGLDLARLSAQTRFINSKLQERAFSWSVLLDELESILGDDVRLISVSPSFTEEGPVRLSLQFESKTDSGLTETIDQMNADPQFIDPFPRTQTTAENGRYKFFITVDYVPQHNPRPAGQVQR